MNQTVYTVQRKSDGFTRTVKTTNDAIGVVRGIFRPRGSYLPYQVTERDPIGRDKVTVITAGDETYTVTADLECLIPIAAVKDCPSWDPANPNK